MSKSICTDNGMENASKEIMRARATMKERATYTKLAKARAKDMQDENPPKLQESPHLFLDDWHGDRIAEAELLLKSAMGLLGEMNAANNRAMRLDTLTAVHSMIQLAAQLVANEYQEEASHA